MFNKYKYLAISSLLLLCGQVSKAQNYCLRYDIIKNTQTVDVRVSLVAEGKAFKLGAGNVQLQFNGNALNTPQILSSSLPTTYKNVNITQPVPVALKGSTDKIASLNFNYVGETGQGLTIAPTGTQIAVLRFKKGKENDIPTLRAYNNSTVGSIVYNDNTDSPELMTSLKTCPVSDVPVTANWLSVNLKSDDPSKTVNLDWSIQADANTKHFFVERSADNQNFETIGQVAADKKLNNYGFVDTKPLKVDAFYRIQQINFDKTESYSDVKVLTFDNSKRLKVFPTLLTDAQNTITIDVPTLKDGKAQIFQIMDASGKIVTTGNIVERTELNVGDFAAGIYVLILGDDKVKFVKQ
jgi:hypothetical protein